jgi:hypothetical protein
MSARGIAPGPKKNQRSNAVIIRKNIDTDPLEPGLLFHYIDPIKILIA